MNPSVTREPAALADHDDADTPRRRVLRAADRLFRRHGVADTSVEDIAVEAGMSRATLYRHVTGGRDEIIRDVVAASVESTARAFAEQVAGETPDFGERMVRLFVLLDEALAADEEGSAMFHLPSMGAMVTVEGWTTAAIELVGRVLGPLLHDARRRGEVSEDLPDELIAEWMVRQFVSVELLRSGMIDDPDRFETYLRSLVVAPLLAPTAVAP